jgi:F0F1-type ATP synthase assembly protein I
MKYAGLATQMAAFIGVFTYLGLLTDQHFHTPQPYFAAIGGLLGIFFSFYLLYKELLNDNQ